MRLHSIKPHADANRVALRAGRGGSSGRGKTAGRGHKGQKSRSGGFHKTGFEGGQMPLQRRLPKIGFSSRCGRTTDEVRLHEIDSMRVDHIDLRALQEAGLVSKRIERVGIILKGNINRAVTIRGLRVTAGVRAAIEAAGGSIQET